MSIFQFILDMFVEKDVRFFNSGNKFMEKKDFLKATYDFKEAIKIKPTEELYHDALGKSLYKRGMIPEADHCFALADDLKQAGANPRDVPALCRLAKAYQDKRMLSVAQNYIQRVLALEPENDHVHCLMGRSCFLLGKVPDAIHEYETAIKLSPYCLDAYKGLEDLFRVEGKKSRENEYEAIGKAIAMAKKAPRDADAHADLGEVFRKYKKNAEAEAEFNEAITIDQKCSKALVGLGVLLLETGAQDKARDNFLQAIKINKYSAIAHSYLGLLYKSDSSAKQKAKWELALAKQLTAVEAAKDPLKLFQAYLELGDFFLSHKKNDDAEEAYLRAIKSNSNDPVVYVKLALLYSTSKRAQQGLDYCDHAIKLSPQSETGYVGKGRVLMQMNDIEKAISHLQEALKFSPNNPDIHEFLAQAYQKKGLVKLADKEWKVVDSIKSTQEGAI